MHAEARMPTYGTDGAACFDLYAADQAVVHSDGPATLVRTGLAVAIPDGGCMLIFPRSGLAARFAVRLANCVAVIDSDYRGEILVPLTCDTESETGYYVAPGDRIAQAMLVPVERVVFDEVLALPESKRGTGGFGSTGS
jgi:dUTP pyrophosphatase